MRMYTRNYVITFLFQTTPPILLTLRTILAVPIVDGIDWNTMFYHSTYGRHHYRGLFEWGFFYKEGIVPPIVINRRNYNSEPYVYVQQWAFSFRLKNLFDFLYPIITYPQNFLAVPYVDHIAWNNMIYLFLKQASHSGIF